jgi:hypothetical protein
MGINYCLNPLFKEGFLLAPTDFFYITSYSNFFILFGLLRSSFTQNFDKHSKVTSLAKVWELFYSSF